MSVNDLILLLEKDIFRYCLYFLGFLVSVIVICHVLLIKAKAHRAQQAADSILKRGFLMSVTNHFFGHSVEPKFPPYCPNCGFPHNVKNNNTSEQVERKEESVKNKEGQKQSE